MTMPKAYLTWNLRVIFPLFYLLASAKAADTGRWWTTAGSVGTVDESDTAKITFTRTLAELNPGAAPTVGAVVRYPVIALDDLVEGSNPFPSFLMNVRFTRSGGRVLVYLKEYSLSSGTTRTLISYNSDHSGVSGSGMGWTCAGFAFDFKNNAYWLETTLIRTVPDQQVAFQGAAIYPGACIP